MAESYVDRVKAGTATIRDVLEQGGLQPTQVGWKRVVEAGYNLDAPASSFNDVEDNQAKLKRLGELASESDFKNYLRGQNLLNKQASNINASPALNVFGAGEVARNIGLESAKQARRVSKFEKVPGAQTALPKVVQAISEIEDPNVRAAVAFNSLVPLRPVEVASIKIGDIDFESGSFTEEYSRGNKIRAKLDLPEFALAILKEQENKARNAGHTHLFFDERKTGGNPANFRGSMTTAINAEGGLRDLLKPYAVQMGREIKGASDLRKLIPSIIVNQLGYAREASAIMGHTSIDAIAGEMAGMSARHYVSDIITEEGSGAKQALRALQNAYGEVLGLRFVNDLAGAMRLDLPEMTTVGEGKKIRVVGQGDTISVRNTVEGAVDEEVKASTEKQRQVADTEADRRIAEASRGATDAKIAEAKRLADPEVQKTLVEAKKAELKTAAEIKKIEAEAKAQLEAEETKAPTKTSVDFSGVASFLDKMGKLGVVGAVTGASFYSGMSEAEEKGYDTPGQIASGLARTAVDIVEPVGVGFMMGELAPKKMSEGFPEGQVPETEFVRQQEVSAMDRRQAVIDEQMGRIKAYDKQEVLDRQMNELQPDIEIKY